ncbi:acyl-CoA dehydrogenase family protein (plasmid) [Cupriavidus pinatubonensis]|uniref:acyl-CoA dehydrogenase family protein n=1 Tax=Cupriavidus pinatubonensis TaxID=248026 RepID=UPI001C72B529|nr:acyl-CoA dehydrogenase family protein [Cupriavidus pinatubonensis]QYY33958.1 acyl-CoA dehydrogenase family protein [Cupriavidus pinatubonensis]
MLAPSSSLARVSESAGGAELPALTYGLMMEQLPPVVAIAVLGQEVTATRIGFDSTPEQRERFLPDLISGKRISCTGTTEPDVGSDSRRVRTRLEDDGPDHFRLSGRKMWITNASICDLINVTASYGHDASGRPSTTRIIVERDQSPYEAREIPVLGLRQGHLGEVLFESCRVPRQNQLGTAGDAARVLNLTWLANRPILGLCAVHMAQRALDAALQYAGDRRQFGRPIASFQLVQEMLADIATAVTTSRLLCYHALSSIDAGDRANHLSAMAKRYSLAACMRAVSLAMEVHGAMGISCEMGLEQLFRDVRMLPIPDGTNQILTLIEGRELTGIQAYRPSSGATSAA